ncbi:type 2 lanthipeptide synthetase LanM [Enterobacter cloacae]|uniref:type 2 lanthipeptide synthetase LanM n=1 Tax=Enterobacter cloacae TaxID=550 RepID=UPI00345D603C
MAKYLYHALKSHSASENIYPILCEHLFIYFNEKTNQLLSDYLYLIDDREQLSKNLARQSVESLSVAVKQLCFFCTKLSRLECDESDNWGSILNSYPVIMEKIVTHEIHVNHIITNLFSRLTKDKRKLQGLFGISGFIVTDIGLFLGDFHQVGESVVKVKFINCILIYKPRDARNERIISDLLVELFNNGLKIGVPRFLDCDSYSWHEFISYSGSKTKDEILEYYNKIGLSLAFFYCLNGTDFHFENIICAHNTPYFIDLECVFTFSYHSSLISKSVLSTFIIPTLQGTMSDSLICGISTKEVLIHKESLEMSSDGDVCHKYIPTEIEEKFNVPTRNGSVSHAEINKEIISGFEEMVTLIKNKESIQNQVKNMKNTKGRMLFRTTKLYSDIIAVSNHPAYSSIPALRNAYIACALYDEDIPLEVVKYEYFSLVQGMIPVFYVDIINEVVTTLEGRRIKIKDSISPRKDYFSKVFRMTNGNEDFTFQKELINISLQTIFPAFEGREKSSCSIEKVIDFMSVRSCKYNNNDVYLNLKKEKNGSRTISVMRGDLYSGLGGATFLQICDLISECNAYKENRLEFLYRTVLALDSNDSGGYFGCFDSKGGMLYLEYLIAKHTTGLIDHSVIFNRLLGIIRMIENQKDANYDIISGIAGVLIVCCRLHSILPTKYTELAIKILTNKLLCKTERKIENTVTWGRGWPGFSHGNSGVAYALALANNFLNDSKIDSVIVKSLKYEETFKIDSGWNGMDAYNTNKDFNSWCHGALGIYMSRVAMFNELKGERTEIKDILLSDMQHYQETRKNRDINDHQSLCHGMYGNAIIDPVTYGTYFDMDIPIYNQAEEKSLMLSSIGAIYTNFYFLHKEKGIPNLLILE